MAFLSSDLTASEACSYVIYTHKQGGEGNSELGEEVGEEEEEGKGKEEDKAVDDGAPLADSSKSSKL